MRWATSTCFPDWGLRKAPWGGSVPRPGRDFSTVTLPSSACSVPEMLRIVLLQVKHRRPL